MGECPITTFLHHFYSSIIYIKMKIFKSLLLAGSLTLLTPMTMAQGTLPYLETNRQGQTHLMVDGAPYLMLGGELHNSSTGSAHYMADIWQRMADIHINTVIAPVSWELIEPVEGHFDFSQLDNMVQGARAEGLRLVILWFGSWKNGMSMYAPAWVKQNPKRFPLAHFKDGQPIAALSTLGTESVKADAKAYRAMMQHLKEIDGEQHTVLMIQIENEMGTLDQMSMYMRGNNRAMRDYSPLANKAFESEVPAALMQYLQKNKKQLKPAIAEAWKAQGNPMKGNWEQVFGVGQPAPQHNYKTREEADLDTAWHDEYPWLTEEIFNTWNYATYVEQIARAGKEVYPIPVYVNAWLKQGIGAEPGKYPSGGPQPHLFDIWHAGAPSVDLLGPDLYAVSAFDYVMQGYDQPGNPVLMPETRPTPDGAARAFYAFGKYNMLCYSPFGIDGNGYSLDPLPGDRSYEKAYGVLSHLLPTIAQYQGTGRMTGLFMEGTDAPEPVKLGKYTISMRRFNTKASQALVGVAGSESVNAITPAGVLVIQTGEHEFIVAGGVGDCTVSFHQGNPLKYTPGQKQSGILSVDEITYDADGKELVHRVNGDETAFGTCVIPDGQVKMFKVKMYEY